MSARLDGIARKALTVSVQEPALLARLNSGNRGGDRDLYRGGPLNPQALNRYSYVLNNPVNATDPTGHAHSIAEPEGDGMSGGGEGPAGGGGGEGELSPPLRTGPKPGTYYDDGRYEPPAAAGEAEAGSVSEYKRITKGNSVENWETNVTPEEFEQNLRDSGWRERRSADGKTTIFEKDGAKYVVRDTANSTGGPTADYI